MRRIMVGLIQVLNFKNNALKGKRNSGAEFFHSA